MYSAKEASIKNRNIKLSGGWMKFDVHSLLPKVIELDKLTAGSNCVEIYTDMSVHPRF